MSHDAAVAAGHSLAVELGVLALACAGLALVAGRVSARLGRYLPAAAGLAVLAVLAVVAVAGPIRLLQHVEHRIEAPPPAGGGDLNARVLSASGSGRTQYWKVAWRMVEREPLLGGGGGSFERWWLQERPVANDARNAHSLYLETLAELGPVGLLLLLLALALPLWAVRTARIHPLASTALAVYVAWLAHAALDWDWQIPAVTLPALGCGAALVVLARRHASGALPAARRTTALGALAVLLVAALVMHAGNRAADGAARAIAAGDDAAAVADARQAHTWMPWAALPFQLAGEAELATHRDADARRSLRRALARDREDWSAWYDLATVTHGAEHRAALRKARALNPLARELHGLR